MTSSVLDLLSAGRLQEAEWLIRRGAHSPLSINELKERLGTNMDTDSFYVSPGYYAPLPSWTEARKCCGEAYQADSVLQQYRQKAADKKVQYGNNKTIDSYTIRQLAALQHAWISLGRPQQLRVLDLGGALGNHFHAIARHWRWSNLCWTVCETEAVVAAGKADFEIDIAGGHQLKFSNEAKEAIDRDIHVVFASCSLQYIEEWQQMLKTFRVSPWLIIDRVPLIENDTDLIDIQVVPASYTDTRYPGWKFAASSWLPRLQEAGFKLEFEWIVPEDRWTILDLETGKIRWHAQHDHGYLLRTDHNYAAPIIFE